LQRDGGDIELIDIRGNEVVIAFRGMCAGCRSAHITKQLLVEAKLKEFVTPEITVVEEGEA
jgi:NifU-like protein